MVQIGNEHAGLLLPVVTGHPAGEAVCRSTLRAPARHAHSSGSNDRDAPPTEYRGSESCIPGTAALVCGPGDWEFVGLYAFPSPALLRLPPGAVVRLCRNEERRMHDVALSELLSSRGFEGESAQLALGRLCRHGMTRSGKSRIAEVKIEAVDEILGAAFVRHCRKPACRPSAPDSREPVLVSAEYCESCGGSDNRRAVEEMLAAMQAAGWTKLLVAGGSPGTRGDLERLCRGRLEQRFITGETTPNRKIAGPPLDWSDVTAIWTLSEISHKATAVLRGRKVLKVPRRGVAALAAAVRDRCRRAG